MTETQFEALESTSCWSKTTFCHFVGEPAWSARAQSLSSAAARWGSRSSTGVANFNPCGPHITNGLNRVSPKLHKTQLNKILRKCIKQWECLNTGHTRHTPISVKRREIRLRILADFEVDFLAHSRRYRSGRDTETHTGLTWLQQASFRGKDAACWRHHPTPGPATATPALVS